MSEISYDNQKRGKMPRQTDYIQQLANYIKRNLAKGYTLDSLKTSLEQQDYSRSAIERAIQLANEQLSKQAPKMIEKPVIKVEIEPPIEEKKSLWQKIKGWFE